MLFVSHVELNRIYKLSLHPCLGDTNDDKYAYDHNEEIPVFY